MLLTLGLESSWSVRTYICLLLTGCQATLEFLDLSSGADAERLALLSPSGSVPLLIDGSLRVHDSLAIIEYLNECSSGALFPTEKAERATARSLCAEIHSGFLAIRQSMPLSLTQNLTQPSLTLTLQKEISRLKAIFAHATGQFMWQAPCAVDAFYAVMAYRLKSYQIDFPGAAGEYQQSLLQWPLFKQAIALHTPVISQSR